MKNETIKMYHKNNRYFDIFNKEGLLGKKEHVKNVITTTMAIADFQHSDVDRELLEICAEHHDDGRVNQYNLLGKFCDSKVSHNVLGIDRLDKFLITCDRVEHDESLDILRNVILYHGRLNLVVLSHTSKEYVELVTAADNFENACSCVSYLVEEVTRDEKGYIKNNPYADQRVVSDFVFDHFAKGEKFDKMKYCRTYAEYVLFAATLATSCIKQYSDVAKVALSQPGYGYDSILEGYKDVFEKTLSPVMAKEAFKVLSSMII